MPINLPTYEQQQQAITLLLEIGVDIDALLAGRVVKSVQRGKFSFTGESLNIGISEVNTAKCAVFLRGNSSTSGTYYEVYGYTLTPNNLMITPHNALYKTDGTWQVIEFY